jgi:hypothetical protein
MHGMNIKITIKEDSGLLVSDTASLDEWYRNINVKTSDLTAGNRFHSFQN